MAFATLLLLLYVLAPGGATQAPPVQSPAQRPAGPRISVDVNLVNVDVTVSDIKGNLVANLKPEDFRILDDGVPQPITHFEAVEAPAQVLLLIETSPAVFIIHRDHLQAAYALLDGLAPDDRVALGTYAQSAQLVLGFTADKRAAAQAVEQMIAGYGLGMAQLNLTQSLSAALDWLRPLPGKKAIVLLATGLDTSPARSSAVLERELTASDVVIFPIALGAELRDVHPKNNKSSDSSLAANGGVSFEAADRAFGALAEKTGGQAYFPKSAREFPAVYRRIATLLRHQYSLGFQPGAQDARYHRIEIQVVGISGEPAVDKRGKPLFRVSHRKTYLAPAN